MSIFGKIKDAIFGKAEAAEPSPQAAPVPNAPPPAGPVTTAAPAPASPTPAPAQPTAASPNPASPAPAGSAPRASTAPVDVAAIMDRAVKESGQTLEWRKSIVDTMKALHLDSSLAERKELAHELGYTGDTDDSATMNVWLHKALMKKLSENGGHVPAELTD